MADAPVIVTGSRANAPAVGKLLEGHNFFLVQRLPSRSRLIADVENNGGRVVKLETKADYIIADHVRKDAPAGSVSYTFVEQAIRNGAIPDPADHPAGPQLGSVRDVGSAMPGKSTRTPFTAEDDKVLWRWVEAAKANGGSSKGNDVYKLLGANNPRHTWQSWRDRYIKKLIDKPPAGVMVAANAPPSPPSAPDNEPTLSAPSPRSAASPSPSKRRKLNATRHTRDATQAAAAAATTFDESDFDALMGEAASIETIHDSERNRAWKAWSKVHDHQHHTAREWREFYETEVRPVYLRHKADVTESEDTESESESDTDSSVPDEPANDASGEPEAEVEEAEMLEPSADERTDGNESYQISGTPERQASKHGTKRKWVEDRSRSGSNAAMERPSSPILAMTSESTTAILPSQSRIAETVDADLRKAFDSVPGLRELQASVQAQVFHLVDDAPPSSSQLITSDMNREAALQLQADAERAETKAKEAASARESVVGDDDELSSLEDAALDDVEDTESSGDALTEANLASQEALHRGKLLRGADLPEDDPSVDQSDFITFLQRNLAGSNMMTALPKSADEEGEEMEGDAVNTADLESRQPLPAQTDDDDLSHDSLPMASSQMRSGRPSQADNGWSSLDAVLLDSQENGAAQPVDDNSPLALRDEFTYVDAEEADGNMFSDDDEGDRTLQQTSRDAGEVIDLRIPEPDGGFTFTSSVHGEADGVPPRGSVVGGSEAEYFNPEAISLSSAALSSPYQSSSASKPLRQGSVTPRKGVKHQVESQDMVDFGSPEAGLDIASPLAGLYDEENHAQERIENPKPRSIRALETQDILDAETQHPDLDVALPPSDDEYDEDSDNESSEASQIPAFPKRTTTKRPSITVESQAFSSTGDDLDEWLATQMVRGYSEDSCMRSILCTSMRPELAELVMLSEKAGTGIPQDVPGIWTEREDRVVESGDAGAIRRLEAKHGWKECEARMKFLAEWREV